MTAEEATTSSRRIDVVEWLLVGGATLFLYPLSLLLRALLGLDPAELAVGFLTFHLAYVLNDPHFCVTYLLFYRRAPRVDVGRAQRARWWLAGAVTPIALVAWAVFSLATRSAQTLGWMVQLMFLLVGLHYVKQGFGVMTVLSLRRGVVLAVRERLALLAHAYAGWAFAWANPAMAAGEFEEKGVVYWAPAHPRWLELVTGALFAVSAIVLLVVLFARKGPKPLPLVPLSGFLVTVWAWTIFSALDPLVRYVIPALHSAQYVYFVWLLRRNEAAAEEGPPSFGRPVAVRIGLLAVGALLLGWFLLRGAPSFLDALLVPRPKRGVDPGPFGETPFFAAFYVIVNIHHFAMDAVLWRRENPDMRWLRG